MVEEVVQVPGGQRSRRRAGGRCQRWRPRGERGAKSEMGWGSGSDCGCLESAVFDGEFSEKTESGMRCPMQVSPWLIGEEGCAAGAVWALSDCEDRGGSGMVEVGVFRRQYLPHRQRALVWLTR